MNIKLKNKVPQLQRGGGTFLKQFFFKVFAFAFTCVFYKFCWILTTQKCTRIYQNIFTECSYIFLKYLSKIIGNVLMFCGMFLCFAECQRIFICFYWFFFIFNYDVGILQPLICSSLRRLIREDTYYWYLVLESQKAPNIFHNTFSVNKCWHFVLQGVNHKKYFKFKSGIGFTIAQNLSNLPFPTLMTFFYYF